MNKKIFGIILCYLSISISLSTGYMILESREQERAVITNSFLRENSFSQLPKPTTAVDCTLEITVLPAPSDKTEGSLERPVSETTDSVNGPVSGVTRFQPKPVTLVKLPYPSSAPDKITPTPLTTPTPTPSPEKNPNKNKENRTKEIKLVYNNTSYRIQNQMYSELCTMIRNEPYLSSFILYDINSKASVCYNESRYFPVASTVKAPFAMTCLWQIDEGLYSLDDTMEYTKEYKVSGTGTIKAEKLGTVFTIRELVEHAILVSDDIGYLMLQGYFGYENYNAFLKELGNRVTIGGGRKWGDTSAEDSLRNWLEIYKYINSDSDNAAFFAELLKNTNKSFVRNALGSRYVVYNKMGWVGGQCCHDHALIMAEQPYVIIIMTMGDVREKNQRFMEKLAVILDRIHEEMTETSYQKPAK